jgi:hypothetical protein
VAERRGPAGVEEQGTFIVGFSRNLGGPVASVDESGVGNPVNNPWPTGVAPCARGSKTRGERRYREAKETKRRGRDGRKSECFTIEEEHFGFAELCANVAEYFGHVRAIADIATEIQSGGAAFSDLIGKCFQIICFAAIIATA